MTTDGISIIKKFLILFLVFAGLYFAKGFLIPLSIGAVLATLFLPLHKWLERKKIPNGVAALLCLFVLLLFTAGIFSLLGWQVSKLTNDFALLKLRALDLIAQFSEFLFNDLGISLNRQTELLKDGQTSVTGIIQTMAGAFLSLFTNTILVSVYVVLLLYYNKHIKRFFMKLSQPDQQKETEIVIHNVAHVSQEYLMGLAKMIVCLWVMYGIGFSILGVENALFFAILCGLLEIVPFIGNLTGTILTLLVAALHGASPVMLIGIACTYGVVQFIQGWVLEPLILGPQVRINPLFTILALVVGQLLWGIPGIFLAIPLIAMLKIICDHVESLKPYGFLIGELETTKKENRFIKRIKSWFKK